MSAIDKADLIQKVAYSSVSKGSRAVSRDVGGFSITLVVPGQGTIQIMAAKMMAGALESKLSGLPGELSVGHRQSVELAVTSFFDAAREVEIVHGLVDADQAVAMRKIAELFGKKTVED